MKPEIICHIMSSVDGRLLPSRWTPPFDGTDPSILFKEYAALGKRLDTDAWMFGEATGCPRIRRFLNTSETLTNTQLRGNRWSCCHPRPQATA